MLSVHVVGLRSLHPYRLYVCFSSTLRIIICETALEMRSVIKSKIHQAFASNLRNENVLRHRVRKFGKVQSLESNFA